MNLVKIIMDLQFGSTGKGQVAGMLARKLEVDTVVSANGPNAGHTFRWTTGDGTQHKIVCTVLPCSAVVPSVRNILLGPGSIIDPQQLITEIDDTPPGLLSGKQLIIHPNAAIVTHEHRDAERASMVHIGSTMKGTAEAVIQKMRRSGTHQNTAKQLITIHENPELYATCQRAGLWLFINADSYDSAIDSSEHLLVEGSQGHSLGMHERFYPYCTSRDVSVHQILADCRIPRTDSLQVIGVCRTFPIRVANRYNSEGDQVGTSGGWYPDQRELMWADLGRAPELTTVTKLPRRIFTFSTQQIMDACRVNSPDVLALTFCDYLEHKPKSAAQVGPQVLALMHRIENAAQAPVMLLGYGPMDTDFIGINNMYPGVGP